MTIYQIFVKLLDGDTRCLQLPSPTISGEALKLRIHAKTGIPTRLQRLIAESRQINDETLISASYDRAFPSCTLLLRLPGGKGGFGSLLRGAATKAGQKKTNNFDACRDMSGRRLRHVNAEKRLEEWRAEAEERRLEKVAEEFLKKKAKEARKNDSKGVEKYLEKYRADAERCTGEVEEAVRQSFGLYEEGKRKALPAAGAGASKRLKLWLGKNKVDESDSDDEDDESDEENKSIVVDDINQKDEAGSSGTISGGQSDGESAGAGSDLSNLVEEHLLSDRCESLDVAQGSGSGDSNTDSDDCVETKYMVCGEPSTIGPASKFEISPDNNDSSIREESDTSERHIQEQMDTDMPLNCSENLASPEKADTLVDSSGLMNVNDTLISVFCPENLVSERTSETIEDSVQPEPIATVEVACQTAVAAKENLLNLDNFSSSQELEALGMERLKMELQANGLKCGGTLQERAARLFLLKTTPVDKLPKKVLAKPSGGRR